MRAIFETGFYIIYFALIMYIGIYLIIKDKERKDLIFFGLACALLGFGDAFHLVPRAIGLITKTLDSPSDTLNMWLGLGKLITSITMTFFYLLIYYFIHKKSHVKRNLMLDLVVYTLLIARFILLILPQNRWLDNDGDLIWGIVRNIPFTILGIIVIVLANIYLKHIKYYKLMWVAIILSFGFYIPVVILASKYSWVGLLMLPKTICYLWIAFMGYLDTRNKKDLFE